MEIINTIIGLGASVMMPIIFFVVGLIFRMGIGKSFKAGMTVGVGFVGVNMVINLLLDNLGPASKAMVNRLGLHLTTVDVGWPTASTVGWGTPIMVATVVGFLVINAIMVFCKLTKTSTSSTTGSSCKSERWSMPSPATSGSPSSSPGSSSPSC